MKRLLAIFGAVLMLSACASPFATSKPSPTPNPNVNSGVACADLVARAMTSPHAVVPGAEACLDPAAVEEMAKASPSITNDAGFEAYAASAPVFTAYRYVYTVDGATRVYNEDVIVYRLVGSAGAECMGVFMQGAPASTVATAARTHDARLVDAIEFLQASTGACG